MNEPPEQPRIWHGKSIPLSIGRAKRSTVLPAPAQTERPEEQSLSCRSKLHILS